MFLVQWTREHFLLLWRTQVWFLAPTWFTAICNSSPKGFFGGLYENSSHVLICFNAWSAVHGAVWERSEDVPLLEEMCPWGKVLKLQMPTHSILSTSLPHVYESGWEVLSYFSSTIPACQMPCSLPWWSWTHPLNCKASPQLDAFSYKLYCSWCLFTTIEQ